MNNEFNHFIDYIVGFEFDYIIVVFRQILLMYITLFRTAHFCFLRHQYISMFILIT